MLLHNSKEAVAPTSAAGGIPGLSEIRAFFESSDSFLQTMQQLLAYAARQMGKEMDLWETCWVDELKNTA
jgi:hypothetical protein